MIEKEVTSLELAKQAKEAGIEIETRMIYMYGELTSNKNYNITDSFPAPTVNEWLEVLPEEIYKQYNLTINKTIIHSRIICATHQKIGKQIKKKGYIAAYGALEEDRTGGIYFYNHTITEAESLQDALCLMAIELTKKGLM